MKKNFLVFLIALFAAALCAFGICACKGPKGDKGADGASGVNVEGAYVAEGNLYLILSGGAYVNCGRVVGTDGADGIDGVGIVDIIFNGDGELVIKFANGEERNIGVSPSICEHRYGDWVVETEATCVTQGYRYCVCEECGFMINRIDPATGHEWDDRTAETVIEPETCTDEGWRLITCVNCNQTQLEKIEATAHVFTIPSYAPEEERYINKCRFCDMRKPSEGLEYKQVGADYHLSGLGSCTDTDIVVADVIDTPTGKKKVTEIDYDAFSGSQQVTSVYFSKYVKEIDHGSGSIFGGENCENMTHLIVHPKNPVYRSDGNCIVDIVNKSVIAGCAASSIPSDGSVTTIGAHAFDGVKLSKLIIPDKIVTLGSYAFANCTNITSLTLGGSLTTIGSNCFSYCAGLETLVINGVPNIGQRAFASCYNLQQVNLNSGCEKVGTYAFVCCRSLTTVRIDRSVERVGNYAFGACGSLTNFRYTGTSSDWWNESLGVGVADENWNATPLIYQSVFTDTPITNADVKFGIS